MFDIRQTTNYANYLSSIGWIVEKKNDTFYFIRKFPFIGSVIKIQRPKKIRFKDIKTLSDKYRAFQIILEPNLTPSANSSTTHHNKNLSNHGYRVSKSPYLPSKTLQLDLAKNKNQLLKSMKKDARLAIKKNNNLKFQVFNEMNMKQFRNAWKKAVGWRRYIPPLDHLISLKKSFQDNSFFLTDQDNNSGAIFLKTKDICYYWQAFTNLRGRKELYQYRIVWEAILWAKKTGCNIFDFEGIYDERYPNKSWLGFTHFKKSFGGYEVSFPGAFIRNNLTNLIKF